MWSETRCVPIWCVEPNDGGGVAFTDGCAALARRGNCLPHGPCRANRTGCRTSTLPRRKPNWRRSVAACIVAARTATRRGASGPYVAWVCTRRSVPPAAPKKAKTVPDTFLALFSAHSPPFFAFVRVLTQSILPRDRSFRRARRIALSPESGDNLFAGLRPSAVAHWSRVARKEPLGECHDGANRDRATCPTIQVRSRGFLDGKTT